MGECSSVWENVAVFDIVSGWLTVVTLVKVVKVRLAAVTKQFKNKLIKEQRSLCVYWQTILM